MRDWGPWVALVVLGCAPVAPRAEHRAPSGTSHPPASSAPPPAPPTAPAAELRDVPSEPSPFGAQAEIPGGITGLHAAGEHLLIEQAHPKRLDVTVLVPFEDGALEVDRKHWAGLPNQARIDAVVGAWPDVSAFVWQAGASSEYGYLFRHSRGGWARQARLADHHVFRSVGRGGRRTVALTGPAPLLYPGPTKLVELLAGGLVPGPNLTKGVAPCPAQIVPREVAVDSEGRVFVFGRRCVASPGATDFAEGEPAVEWFARGQRRGSVVDLPAGASGDAIVLSSASGRVVFSLSETSRRLSFDGARFELAELEGPMLSRLERASDATRWAVRADNRVLRAPAGDGDDAWEEVPLPERSSDGIPLAVVGNEAYVAIGERLYQYGAPERSPLPKYELAGAPGD